jgi:hypothetical protein
MKRRRAAIDAREEALNSNFANRYYRDGGNRRSHEHYCRRYRYHENTYKQSALAG